jgi:hypothetical protein
MKLDGEVAAITGAGRRIGRAIVTLQAEEGAKVALLARTAAEVDSEAVAEEIAARGGSARLPARRCRPRHGHEGVRRNRKRSRPREPARQQRRRLHGHRPDLGSLPRGVAARRRNQCLRNFQLLLGGNPEDDCAKVWPHHQHDRRGDGYLLSQRLRLRDEQGRPSPLYPMHLGRAHRQGRPRIRDGPRASCGPQ